MKNEKSLIEKIFKISLLIYPITIAIATFCGIVFGIDSGWAMPAMSSGRREYGFDAIVSYIIIFVMLFPMGYISVLIFQIGYLIARGIAKLMGE